MILSPAPSESSAPGFRIYAGLFLLCLSTVVYEITLTRLFSALMYYHFASMAIAVAMLGTGLGGTLVYLWPSGFRGRDGLHRALPLMCLLYGGTTLVLYLCGLAVTLQPDAASTILSHFHTQYQNQGRLGAGTGSGLQGQGLLALLALAAATTVPFCLAGAAVAAVLRGFPAQVSALYLADMLGAGLGAIVLVFLMGWLGGPATLLVASLCGAGAALIFLDKWNRKPLTTAALGLFVASALLTGVEHRGGLVRFDFVGGRFEPGVLDSRWNSFSRVLVYRGKTGDMQERAWGVSRSFTGPHPEELNIVINDTGFTTMVKAGQGSDLSSLRYDVTNLPFMLRPGGRTLVIGPGGGRDVLSALEFGSKDVTAVEVNPLLRDVVEDKFGDFTGRPYSMPGVRLVIDDGRSFLLRDTTRYDVIESARVYEWVEAMSGAFTFSENYLYTEEAFRDYLSHLNESGLLSITRFIHERQAVRILSLALAAYGRLGVPNPESSIAILKERGLATFLFKRRPFTPEELETLAGLAADLGFGVVYLPGRLTDNDFTRLIRAPDREAFIAAHPLDLSPTTDDKPFFNFMVKRGDFWSGRGDRRSGGLQNQALAMLRSLFVVMFVFSVSVFVLPLAVARTGRVAGNSVGRLPLLFFFGAIGLGFMLVEITFLRKFILFLGQPVYSLSVVLFVLLVASGVGSFLSGRLEVKKAAAILWSTPAAVAVYAFAPDAVFRVFLASSEPVRICVAIALLFPVGLLLGGMFPSGIRLAAALGLGGYIPWFWAMNGVFSVTGTVFALAFAMSFGFTATLLAGSVAYAAAAACLWLATRTAAAGARGLEAT